MNIHRMMRRFVVAAAVAAFPLGTAAAVELPESAVLDNTVPQSAALESAVLDGVLPDSTLATDSTAARGFVSDHVIVVSIDGLRPDAIETFETPTLDRLIGEGSYTMEASTILPSKTLPSHTSMLTGTEPEQHGVTWNSKQMEEHGHIATPTIFAAAKKAGFETAAFFSKTKFEHLNVPGTLDHFEAPDNFLGKRSADKTIDRAKKYLKTHKPNLLFVHIGEPDFVGHVTGWMSDPYGWAVKEADENVGKLLEAADDAYGTGNYTVIVTADHGGHDRDHGSDDPRDVTIPWITWGKGVEPGVYLGNKIRTMDTAATALWLLGAKPTTDIAGHEVAAAFTATRTVTVAPQR